jgi:lipopolysaccharide transport system permease protein
MRRLPVNVYTPRSPLAQPSRLFSEMRADLLASRGLAWRLAVRDVTAQYRQALLGIVWAFLLPLANSGAWIFLSHSGVVSVRATPMPYALYVTTGSLLWAMFIEAVNMPLQQTQAARSFLAKLNFPREALILSGVYQVAFNAVIKLAILLAACAYAQQALHLSAALVPLAAFSLILVGTAVGLFVTPVGMLYSDVGRVLPLVMQFGMFVTPVAVPMPEGGLAATLLRWNPLSPLILTGRDWLTGNAPNTLAPFLLTNIVAACLLFVFWIAYRLAMPILIERMSA